jgi:hypothetical protein
MIRFLHYPNTQLYLPPEGLGGGFLAFYLCSPPDPLPPELSILETWQDYKGYYLFLKTRPKNLEKFATDIIEFLPGMPVHTSFAWVHYSEQKKPEDIDIDLLKIHTKEELLVTVTIAEDFFIPVRNLAFYLKSNSPVIPTNDNEGNINGFTIEYPLKIEGDPFYNKYRPEPIQGKDIHIPFTGNERGCLKCDVSFCHFSDILEEDPDVGFYYFIKESYIPQHYPLLEPKDEDIQMVFHMSWDPVDIFNKKRTYFAFTGIFYKLVPTHEEPFKYKIELVSSYALKSYFRTIYGDKIGLVPLTNTKHPAKFVLSELPPGMSQTYYLVPDGDFELVITSNSRQETAQYNGAPYRLMCGFSGIESIGFTGKSDKTPGGGDILSFFADKPACVPVFPLISEKAPKMHDLLDPKSKYTTAWMSVRPGAASQNTLKSLYYSQPEGAELFGKDKEKDEEPNYFLSFSESPAAQLPHPEEDTCFPMLPISGAKVNPDLESIDKHFLKDFELQIINPSRRETIFGFPTSAPVLIEKLSADNKPGYSTTPQGLLVELNENNFGWKQLVLARNRMGDILQFKNLNSTLQAAFQTNQQFLVITKDEYLKAEGTEFHNKISLDGWPFQIDVSETKGNDYKNVMIFKFCDGALKDRVKDVNLWTNPTKFNNSTGSNLFMLSQWLEDYIEIAHKSSDPSFAYFNKIVKDKNWNGILALNVGIDLGKFPLELQGLLGGMDMSRFSAHHLGIEVNRVAPDDEGNLQMDKQSSLFGLISYIDRAYEENQKAGEPDKPVLSYVETDYDFKVLLLNVLFENSEVKDFTSKLQITISKLFEDPVDGEATEKHGVPYISLVLDGDYESQNGCPVYTFRNISKNIAGDRFYLESNVLNYVSIVKTQFNTVVKQGDEERKTPGEETRSKKVDSRFTFSGYLNFFYLEGFDDFSYGDEVVKDDDIIEKKGLSFSNLVVDMSFDIKTPSERTFTFDASHLSFDDSQSEFRDNSLRAKFPMKVRNLIIGTEDKKPEDLGYLPISIKRSDNEYRRVGVSGEWYGLDFDLNMGTPGALAEKAGFTAHILLAWQPGSESKSKDYKVYSGIKLPGIGGENDLIGIQGVLKVSVGSIDFIYIEKTSAYLLKLHDIALKFLIAKIPPGATIDFLLFGDPTQQSSQSSMGWYAAYNKKEKELTRL